MTPRSDMKQIATVAFYNTVSGDEKINMPGKGSKQF